MTPPTPQEKPTKHSATEPDWSREQLSRWWEPGKQLLRSIRRYQKWAQRGGLLGTVMCKVNVLHHRFWSVIASADIPLNSQIGGGLLMLHPNGIVIHPEAVIGPNCFILQQVTIVGGVNVGGNVELGAGAKIIRPVTIGNNVYVGANAVVLSDIPDGATAVGVPAKILQRTPPEPASIA